jgi:hypothetical protein
VVEFCVLRHFVISDISKLTSQLSQCMFQPICIADSQIATRAPNPTPKTVSTCSAIGCIYCVCMIQCNYEARKRTVWIGIIYRRVWSSPMGSDCALSVAHCPVRGIPDGCIMLSAIWQRQYRGSAVHLVLIGFLRRRWGWGMSCMFKNGFCVAVYHPTVLPPRKLYILLF